MGRLHSPASRRRAKWGSDRIVVYYGSESVDQGTVWLGECVTLNLVTTRRTFEEAERAIREQIGGYLETVAAGDPTGLVPRKSPLRRRLKYWLRYQLSRLLASSAHPVYRQDQPLAHAHAA